MFFKLSGIFIQYIAASPSQSNQVRKGNKSSQIGKEEAKLPLFTDDMT